jgi:multisubunit Na+/H+ antiporter MnhE subunit
MNEKTSYTHSETVPARIFGTLVSYVFHPIFLVPYMAAYLIYGQPSLYLGASPHDKLLRLITALLNTAFFPLFAILLAKGLGFIQSLHLKDQKDRIIPYIVTLTCYFWAWMAFKSFNDTPPALTAMLFGAFLAASLGLTLNSFLKISMHTIGVGGLLMFMLLLSFQGAADIGLPLVLSILIAGLVYSARMVVSDHTPKELGLGFIVGMLCQIAGFAFFASLF